MEQRDASVPACPAADSDVELVARAQRGEEIAFVALFEGHRRHVYSLCLRMTRNAADAEDLTQEAFLHVFRKIETFRGDSTFSTWLHRLVVNAVLEHLRKKRLPQVGLDRLNPIPGKPATREYRNDDRWLLGTIDRIKLSQAIAQLPPRYQAVLVLFDLEGYRHTEIARIMNWSVASSKSHLHKARQKLRHWLRPRRKESFSMKLERTTSKGETKKSLPRGTGQKLVA